MEVEKGQLSSFLWKSLEWGHELIELGSRWRVGHGRTIRIYDDHWIPRVSTFKVQSPSVLGTLAMVDSLKLPFSAWNKDLIRQSFFLDEVEAILSLPPCGFNLNDSLV